MRAVRDQNTYLLQILTAFRFKVDQVDEKLNAIWEILQDTSQNRTVDPNTVEHDQKTLKINVEIRAVANQMAKSIAMQEPRDRLRKPKSYKALAAPATNLDSDGQVALLVNTPGRRQLDNELQANRDDLKHLIRFSLYDSAVGIQRRAIEIKMLLEPETWLQGDEHYKMQEELADILLQCDAKEPYIEALTILRRLLAVGTRDITSSTSLQAAPESIDLHLKIGKAYKDTAQLDLAKSHLRAAFDACDNATSKDLQQLQIIGEHLQEVYESQVQCSDETQRAVRISQLRGFRKELENSLGRPFTEYVEAVNWCESANIVVPKINARRRFDIVDPDTTSSPLHIAAEKCHDKTILKQIIENSDTLESLNEEKETTLLVAVDNSNTDAIALLIKNGASVKACDKEKKTALHKSQKPSVTRLLLQSRTRRASSASAWSRGSEEQFRRASESSSATTTTGTTDSNLPPDDELNIDAQDAYQRTPLWTACTAGRAKTVDLLLEAGADPDKARYGTTPLAAVIESRATPFFKDPEKRFRIVTALIRAGADPKPGKELLLRKPKGIDYKRLLQALDAPPAESRALLSPTSIELLTLPVPEFNPTAGFQNFSSPEN